MKTAIFALSFLLVWISAVHPQPVLYQGQTIRIVVGVPAGDVYDLWSRLIAAHMGKHIPGRPEFIVQNMPGAGSIIAANYVYGVAKRWFDSRRVPAAVVFRTAAGSQRGPV